MNTIQDFFVSLGVGYSSSIFLAFISLVLITIIVAISSHILTKRYLVRLLKNFFEKAHLHWFQSILKHKVIEKFSFSPIALVLYLKSSLFTMKELPFTENFGLYVRMLALIFAILTLSKGIFAFLNAIEDIYSRYEVSKKRPIKSYLQVLKIFVFSLALILVLSTFVGQSPMAFITGLTAASAVFAFIFKDFLTGFVSTIQLTFYDLVRIGDWIQLLDHNADGHVTEIALTTVKVRNFDRTITTLPSTALINGGVKNWRGIIEAGGRRIKRSIHIDMNSIKFLEKDEIKSLKDIGLFSENINKKSFHSQNADPSPTNLKLFRHYVTNYLTQQKNFHHDKFLFLVRYLEAGSTGLPLEIYIFTKTVIWKEYEEIQSDTFDHLYATLPRFQLRAFQNITGNGIVEKSVFKT